MKKLIHLWPAGVVAIGLTVLGLTTAAERRGLANMADAAPRFLAASAPEQRSQALIAFETDPGRVSASWARGKTPRGSFWCRSTTRNV